MKSKIIDMVLLMLVLGILGLYFGIRSQIYERNALMEYLDKTEKLIKEEKWNEAEKAKDELKSKWERVRFLVMLNYAETDFSLMEENINHLSGGIDTEDKTSALSSVRYIKNLWSNMEKLVPQP
ncbi:MAG: DUF4363 family protein [Bacillota bacterium]